MFRLLLHAMLLSTHAQLREYVLIALDYTITKFSGIPFAWRLYSPSTEILSTD